MNAIAEDTERVMPGVWLMVWTIYLVKLVMIFAIFWSANSFEPTVLVAATTWFWLGPAIAIGASPAAFRLRLRRIRKRRTALIASEWMTTEPDQIPMGI